MDGNGEVGADTKFLKINILEIILVIGLRSMPGRIPTLALGSIGSRRITWSPAFTLYEVFESLLYGEPLISSSPGLVFSLAHSFPRRT